MALLLLDGCLLNLPSVRGLGPLPSCLPRGPCQGPVKDSLTLLGNGICIPIILLTQPIQVWSCLKLSKACGIICCGTSSRR